MSFLPEILTHLVGDSTKSKWRTRLLAAGTTASLLAAWYINTDLGLRLQRTDVTLPSAAWEPVESNGEMHLRMSEAYRTYTLQEFSKSYFGHANHYEPLALEMPFEVKTIYKNRSHGKGRTLASIEALVTSSEMEETFPWERLDVTARVEVKDDALWSSGVGPALNLTWSYGTPTLSVSKGSLPVLTHMEGPVGLLQHVHPIASEMDSRLLYPRDADGLGTDTVSEGVLEHPLYLRVHTEKESSLLVSEATSNCTDEPIPVTAYGWYKEIRTVADLRVVTPVIYQEPLMLDVTWEALDGKLDGIHAVKSLPKTVLLWRAQNDLYESDPRCVRMPPMYDRDGDGMVDGVDMMPVLEALAGDKVAPPLEGVDTWTSHFEVSLRDAGSRATAAEYPDVILNPQGLLFVYLRMTGIEARHYTYTLRVEGEDLSVLEFEPLVPEFQTFEEEGREEAITRLSALLRK